MRTHLVEWVLKNAWHDAFITLGQWIWQPSYIVSTPLWMAVKWQAMGSLPFGYNPELKPPSAHLDEDELMMMRVVFKALIANGTSRPHSMMMIRIAEKTMPHTTWFACASISFQGWLTPPNIIADWPNVPWRFYDQNEWMFMAKPEQQQQRRNCLCEEMLLHWLTFPRQGKVGMRWNIEYCTAWITAIFCLFKAILF